jgi:hypothetical protein
MAWHAETYSAVTNFQKDILRSGQNCQINSKKSEIVWAFGTHGTEDGSMPSPLGNVDMNKGK